MKKKKIEQEQIDLFANTDLENDENIKKEMESLRDKINYYSVKYYEEDEPEISDYEFDQLTQKLRMLELKHPELITKDSYTQKIGGKTKKIFEQVQHDVQMQSLQDVFSFEEVSEYVQKVMQEYGENTQFIVETKIDGLSVSLEYVEGKLVRGSTRGDRICGRRCDRKFETHSDNST